VAVHGWIYGLQDGRLRDLNTTITDPAELPKHCGQTTKS
jgi:carbonic anhydrase